MKLRYPATVFFFVGLLWLKAIYPVASGISDIDFFWHLAYGQWIVANLKLPEFDAFTWTFAGQPYQLTQWLGEAAMGAVYNLAELKGTRFLSVILAGVTILFSWLATRRFVHTSAALVLAVMCNIVQIVTPMRPQLFTFAMLTIAVYLAISYVETKQRRFLAWFPVVMALWVNLHGGFVVGLLLIGLVTLGLVSEAYCENRLPQERSNLVFCGAMTLVSVLATTINPYGYKAITTVAMISGLQSSNFIAEWMPVNFTSAHGWFYLLNLVPFIAVIGISGIKPRVTYGLVGSFFLFFGVLANRQVPVCGAVMAPMIAAVLAQSSHYKKMLPAFGNPDRVLVHGVLTAALAVSLPFLAGLGDAAWRASETTRHPVKATEFLVENGMARRVMADISEGVYLIHRGIPAFIDSRMDLFQDQFFYEWYLASRAAPGWQAFIDRHRPDALLLRHEMAVRQAALASGKWKQVFEDERYSVLVPMDSNLPEIEPKQIVFLDGRGHLVRPYLP